MTDEDRAWLTVDCPLGDTRLPFKAEVRDDGLTMITVGDDEVHGEYDAMCDVEQLSVFIDMLTIARDCAKQATEGNDGSE